MDLTDIYHIYSDVVKGVLGLIISLLFTFDLISVVLINRTKHTSKNTRFLSSSLVGFDAFSLVAVFLRLFISNKDIMIRLREAGFFCLLLGFVTVFMMCIERLILFAAPTKYIMYFRPKFMKRFAIVTWISLYGGVNTIMWAKCGLRFHFTPEYIACTSGIIKSASTLIFLTNILAGAIYVKIIHLIVTLSRRNRTTAAHWTGQKYIQPKLQMRNTTLVFTYLITLTSMNICILMWYVFGSTNITLRTAYDMTIMLSAIIDPCLYVLWFKESKFELLKLFSMCIPSLKNKIESMRTEVYNIVTR